MDKFEKKNWEMEKEEEIKKKKKKEKKREEISKYGLKNTKIGKKCDICLNNIKLNGDMILFDCSHEFHVGCRKIEKRSFKNKINIYS